MESFVLLCSLLGKRCMHSGKKSVQVQKKGRHTSVSLSRPLMWTEALLIFKSLPGAPGTQFCLGDETGALASPHLGREQLPSMGKRVAVAKPVQAHAKQAARCLYSSGHHHISQAEARGGFSKALQVPRTLPRANACLKRFPRPWPLGGERLWYFLSKTLRPGMVAPAGMYHCLPSTCWVRILVPALHCALETPLISHLSCV